MKIIWSYILFFCVLPFVTMAQPKAVNEGNVNTDSLIETISELQEELTQDEGVEFDEDNDEDKYEQDYNDNDEEYQEYLRTIDSAQWAKTKLDKRFIYKKEKLQKEKKVKKSLDFGKFLNADIVKTVLYILFGGFLLVIIYLFFKNNNLSFGKNVKDKKIEQESPWEDVQNFEDWELALQDTLRDKNYRLATRIYYLQTLNKLNKAQIIVYKQEKTNWYYVQKIIGTNYHDDFRGLTTSFDYIWYGDYALSPEQFVKIESQFKNFHNKITL